MLGVYLKTVVQFCQKPIRPRCLFQEAMFSEKKVISVEESGIHEACTIMTGAEVLGAEVINP